MTNKPAVKASLARKGNPLHYGVLIHIDGASIIRIDFIIVLARSKLVGAIPHAWHAVREIPTLHQTPQCGFDFENGQVLCTLF